MIASVRGTVQSVRLDGAVVEVGGVGLLVHATPATLATLRIGATVSLATSLLVREDALTLFGFADADEREVFETVQTVSGVGPRLALAMLAVHSPDALRRAVQDEDLTALKRVPGIGHKGAQRIVLELAGRLGAPSAAASDGVARPETSGGGGARPREQVTDALVGLGWTAKAAQDAVTGVADSVEASGETLEVASLLRATLRALGGGRG
ncbi:MAG TPA: Holliday junction branch migration protein RuvA [Cellulomonadaceae bacterium]|nr:Holliday junction branch migration protein RuvA [Cellulomonadaceae bacterium]